MDIDYGQGWLFGRPGEAWPRTSRPRAAAPCRGAAARPARARPRARRHGARRERGGRRPPGAARAAAGRCFLASGGRLRCQAVRGLLAGLRRPAADARASSGACSGPAIAAVVDDVGEAPDYLPADPRRPRRGLLPLHVGGQVVGRARRRVADRDRRGDRRRDRALRGAAVGAAGGASAPSAPPRRPSGWRAPRSRLAATEDPEGVVREALAAALELSGFESGVIALTDGHGALYPHLAEGPFARRVQRSCPPGSSPRWPSWVDEATSSYTVGDTAGRGFNGHEVLRRAGAGSLIVLPLTAAGERLGPDRARRPREPPPGVRGRRAARAARRCRPRTACGWRRCSPSCASASPATR